MDVNEGDFHESRRKTRNNSPDAAQRRRANKITPTQQAMVQRNKLQATVAINYSLSLSLLLYLLRSVARNDAMDVEELDGNTEGQRECVLLWRHLLRTPTKTASQSYMMKPIHVFHSFVEVPKMV
jgi:hypothetical protein